MTRVLVTGADGFIGSHLVELLVREGHEVRAFTMYNSFDSRGWLDDCDADVRGRFEVHAGDIRDPHGVRAAIRGCDVVFHLAALIGIPYSYHSPDTYVDTNIRGTLNVLQASRELDVQQVVHTSTSEVYGTAQAVPIAEEHPLQAQSPYAASKIAADQMALAFHRSFNTPVTVIRPFNTYGPRQSTRAVIPTTITQLARGNRVELGSLHPTRDFTLVTDTVAAFVAAMGAESSLGEVINVGSGFEVSIAEVVGIIADLMGKSADVAAAKPRVRPEGSEVERLWADTAKAGRVLHWQAAHAGLDGFRRGLATTISWYLSPGNLQRFANRGYVI